MAVYKLFPKNGSINAAAQLQRQAILAQLQQNRYKKDINTLEQTLNDFFYAKQGDNFQQYYERASNLASQAFNEKYSAYPFELNMEKLSATFQNPNINFISESTADLIKIKALANEIELYMQNTGIKREGWNDILTRIKEMQTLSNWADVKDINGIVASILFGNKTVYGDAFEYPLAAFATLLDEGAEAEVDQLLKTFSKNLQGASRSKSYLDIQHLSKKDKKALKIKNNIMINEGAKLEYANPTQDKIDVTLTLNAETYNISAKSYSNIYKDIHILGGAPLTAPVLNLSSTDFVSHYLTQLYLDKDLESAHEAVRLNILFMALTGTGSSTTPADTFVINDKGTRHIYVRSMPDIINNVAVNNKWQHLNINNQGSEIPDQPLRNYAQYKMKNNVASMLSTMHTIKLQVSVKGTAIRDSITEKI